MRGHGKREAAPAASPASQAGFRDRGPVPCRTEAPLPYGRRDERDDWDATVEGQVIGYARVSTDDQAENGVSLEEQQHRIRSYADAHGLQVVRIESDNGISGKAVANRPALQRVLAALQEGDAGGLVVCKMDRLSRTTSDILQLVARADHEGWELHSLCEHLDTSTPHGRFFVTMIAGLAQMEREQAAERTRLAMAELRRRGKRVSGRAPFGYRFEDGNVVPVEKEQRILTYILELRAEGLGARRIARALREVGLNNPRTRRWWTHGTVGDLLRTAARRAV
jgi:site-specific DNA recombinase